MKWALVVIILLALFGGLIAFTRFYKPPKSEPINLPTPYQNETPSATSSATPDDKSFCTSDMLSATAQFEAAAGNVYGALTITNTSNEACNVILGNNIKANYIANNISVAYKNEANDQTFSLSPGAKVYSQIHYPNGPQCQSPITPQGITITYEVNGEKINFKDQTGNSTFNLAACLGSEDTQIDLWPLTSTPVTP